MAAPRLSPAVDQCVVTSTPYALIAQYADSEHCRVVRETFDRVGDKWSLLVIVVLSHGPQRFTALKYGVVGISQRMLTLTLRKLERDGVVQRTVFPEIPPRVEYQLTPLGETLIGPVNALADWAVANQEAITANQKQYDALDVSGSLIVNQPREMVSARSGR
jgi:DNA-binding HxlR family transcriptional regulator